jgi:hypothetical protein
MNEDQIIQQLISEGYTDDEIAQALAGPKTPAQESDFSFQEMMQNVPGSAAQYAEDVTYPIRHPIETAKNIGQLGLGLVQKAIPGEQESEKYVDALGDFYSQRYGSIDQALNTLEQDPVGVWADLSMLFTGGAGLTQRLSKLANVSEKGRQVTTAISNLAAATDPVNVVKNVFAATDVPFRLYQGAAKFKGSQAHIRKNIDTAMKQWRRPTEKRTDPFGHPPRTREKSRELLLSYPAEGLGRETRYRTLIGDPVG